MKSYVTILLFLLSLNIFAQNEEIEELKESLRSYKSGEQHYGVKHDKAYKLLSLDKYNNIAITYLLSSYREMKERDSIPLFFNRLIKDNPNDIEPYLIRERYSNYENPGYTSRINNLKKAHKIEPNNVAINYLLGKLYYELFNREYKRNKKKENLDYYSLNSSQYFTTVCKQKEDQKESLKYPLLQLASYLEDIKKIKLYESYNKQYAYFPIDAFLVLPKDWRTNFSINVIEYYSAPPRFERMGIELAVTSTYGYSLFLSACNEPILDTKQATKIFRFTYLRSFHNPIIIRIENNNEKISIYWKVSDGAGGYEPGEIIEDKTKDLKQEDWELIESKIKNIKFWSLPTTKSDLLGLDGSKWIIEGKTLGKYHVVERWCGEKLNPVGRLLIKLTDLEIEEKEIY